MSNEPNCSELRILIRDDDTEWEAVKDRLRNISDVSDCLRNELADALERQDWGIFETALLAADNNPSSELIPILCRALEKQDRAVPNEDILELLADLGDPRSLDTLRRTIWWNPPWDEFYWIAVKAVGAVWKIDSEEATEVLRDATLHPSENVRSWAIPEFERRTSGKQGEQNQR